WPRTALHLRWTHHGRGHRRPHAESRRRGGTRWRGGRMGSDEDPHPNCVPNGRVVELGGDGGGIAGLGGRERAEAHPILEWSGRVVSGVEQGLSRGRNEGSVLLLAGHSQEEEVIGVDGH